MKIGENVKFYAKLRINWYSYMEIKKSGIMNNGFIKLGSVFILLIVIASGCKKGANDPFISLSSRNARVTGVWNLVTSKYESIDVDLASSVLTTTTDERVFDGSVNTSTYTSPSGVISSVSTLSQKIEINKDGTYKATSVQDGDETISTGDWWWTNDKKKKTRIAFDDDADSFELDRLTKKEMIWTSNYYYKNTDVSGDYSETTTTSTYTFEKEK